MPVLAIEYHDENERLALEQAIAFFRSGASRWTDAISSARSAGKATSAAHASCARLRVDWEMPASAGG